MRETLDTLLEYPVLPITGELVKAAWAVATRFQISYWDGAIIAAAQDLGCVTLYSEDLNDGQNYDGVIVKNPFSSR